MLTILGQAQFFLHQDPVDMRKSFEGLGTIIEEEFPGKLLSGAYSINKSRHRTRSSTSMAMESPSGTNAWKEGLSVARAKRPLSSLIGSFSCCWGDHTGFRIVIGIESMIVRGLVCWQLQSF